MNLKDLLEKLMAPPKEPPKLGWHNLMTCRAFAKEVWTDKVLLKCDLSFTSDHLHNIIHANEQLYYDVCPGETEVNRWFRDFKMEVC